MKKIKLPNPTVIFLGGLGAFWLASFINPGFNPIGVMVLMFIPILIFEFLYPQPELEQLVEQLHYQSIAKHNQKSTAPDVSTDEEAEE
jgi:hypothetical protein